jgi:hypothetical protein
MNIQDHEFDTVVLGFDDKSKETVEALKTEGKRVLYIPIDPQTMITMMAQKRVHSTETNETITHIQIQQHQMQTSFQNTTTYLLQPIIQMYNPDPIEEQTKDQAEEVVEMDLHITSEDNVSEVVLKDEVEPEKVAFSFADVDSENDEEVTDEPTPISSLPSQKVEEETEEKQEESEEELVEKQEDQEEVEERAFSFPMITPLAKESSLIDNRLLGIRRNKYPTLQRNEKNGLTSSMISSYHLFNPIRIEEEQTEEQKTEQEQQNEIEARQEEQIYDTVETEEKQHTIQNSNFINDNNNFIFHGPPPLNTMNPLPTQNINQDEDNEKLTQPNSTEDLENEEEWNEEVYKEQATFIKENKLPDMDELVLQSNLESESDEGTAVKKEQEVESNIYPEEERKDSTEEQEQEQTDSHTLVLNRDIRLRKKFSFHQLHQETKSNPTVDSTQPEKTTITQTEEEQTKKPDVFPLEPFSSRRRNKKSRLFSSLEAAIPNPIIQPSTTAKPEKSFSSLIQESIIQHDLEDESVKSTKPEPSDNVVSLEEEETKTDTIETNSDNLKIDNIEFEEPYGYNSFEDFFPSFSNSNDRKRQEMDKIEKRKIALRGLHNLINNLG